MKTTLVSMKDLKAGMEVIFYGATFVVDTDARKCREEADNNPAYGAECHIKERVSQSNISGLLNGYTWFQGIAEVHRAVIVNEQNTTI